MLPLPVLTRGDEPDELLVAVPGLRWRRDVADRGAEARGPESLLPVEVALGEIVILNAFFTAAVDAV